jgi:hypothetical protein
MAKAKTLWALARLTVVGVLVVGLVVDWLAFQSDDFEHPVGHDVGMSPTDSGADSAIRIALVLMFAILIVGLWPRLVDRYRRVWN